MGEIFRKRRFLVLAPRFLLLILAANLLPA
jgi:hypothetical protein